MISFWRIIKTGLINFVRNGVLSLASTTVMILTLLTLSVFFIINVALTTGIEAIQNKIDVSAYLKDEVKEKQILELQNRIAKLPEVKTVKYVSKDEALERYKIQNANRKELLESLEGIENPLPASLEIKVYDPSKLDQVTAIFDEKNVQDLVRKVSYKENKVVIDKLFRATQFVKNLGLTFTATFALIAFVIIYNTIRIAIFSQKDDIEIMRLVGATNWFIRGPYLVEGVLYGLIATIISVLLLSILLFYAGPSINNYFGDVGGDITNYLRNNVFIIFLLQLGIGSLIGTTSSLLALRKYLEL